VALPATAEARNSLWGYRVDTGAVISSSVIHFGPPMAPLGRGPPPGGGGLGGGGPPGAGPPLLGLLKKKKNFLGCPRVGHHQPPAKFLAAVLPSKFVCGWLVVAPRFTAR